MEKIADWWANVQSSLLPYIEERLPPHITPLHRRFIVVLDLVRVEEYVPGRWWHWRGRPADDRRALARAFLAKAFFNFPTTEALHERLLVDEVLRRLCGWERRRDIPSLSTFSRAFGEFADSELTDRVHASLVRECLEDTVVWHVSRDSTAIRARERPVKKEKAKDPKPKRARGRPKKGESRPKPEKTRLERQYCEWTVEEALAELPRACDIGAKKRVDGSLDHWVGYKFHVDVGDTGVPLLAVTTSASLHDSQAAIPMSRMTAKRVTSLYDLMDSAYEADYILKTSLELGHVPIVERNPRNTEQRMRMEPDRRRRYAHRANSERFNSALKDNHGGRNVRVRGHRKVHTHLMFGLLAVFAEAVMGWFT